MADDDERLSKMLDAPLSPIEKMFGFGKTYAAPKESLRKALIKVSSSSSISAMTVKCESCGMIYRGGKCLCGAVYKPPTVERITGSMYKSLTIDEMSGGHLIAWEDEHADDDNFADEFQRFAKGHEHEQHKPSLDHRDWDVQGIEYLGHPIARGLDGIISKAPRESDASAALAAARRGIEMMGGDVTRLSVDDDVHPRGRMMRSLSERRAFEGLPPIEEDGDDDD